MKPIEKFIINKLSQDTTSKSAKEIQIENAKAKVDLFKSFHGRKPEECKEMFKV